MPAPTALKKADDAPPSNVLPGEAQQDEELLLDAADLPADGDSELILQKVPRSQEGEEDGEGMAIDEEGRPRFAPGRDIVRLTSPPPPHSRTVP